MPWLLVVPPLSLLISILISCKKQKCSTKSEATPSKAKKTPPASTSTTPKPSETPETPELTQEETLPCARTQSSACIPKYPEEDNDSYKYYNVDFKSDDGGSTKIATRLDSSDDRPQKKGKAKAKIKLPKSRLEKSRLEKSRLEPSRMLKKSTMEPTQDSHRVLKTQESCDNVPHLVQESRDVKTANLID